MRTALLTAALATALTAGALTAAPAEARSTDQSYWVPVTGRLILLGHGYGHGHGMSQYGAEGAARAGLSHQQILRFYYQGTTLGRTRTPIRVLITADTTPDLQVRPARGLTLRDRGDGSTYRLKHKGATAWRIKPKGGKDTVGYLTDRWHRFRPGGRATLRGEGELSARRPLRLVTPYGDRTYRGTLRAAHVAPGSGDRDTVNVLSMDQYVQGVVPAEMPASWHPEAVQAQAVAARTYAAWSRSTSHGRSWQICDTTSCQVYGGVGSEDPRGNAAVRATAGQILRHAGKPAFTQFASSSGGWTSDGGQPYLRARKDRFDGWSGNPVHSWSVPLTAARLERAYPAIGRLARVHVTQRDGHGQWHGRVERLVLDGTRSNRVLSGDDLRLLLGLRSSWFSLAPTAITERWRHLGGRRSSLGEPVSRERAVPGGSRQRFEHGNVYWTRKWGAREVTGRVLEAYRRQHGPRGDLGLPRTGMQDRGPGLRVRFQHGTVYDRRPAGTITLSGPVVRRYRRTGEGSSRLGWPTSGLRSTGSGQRADFQHGWITLDAATGRTKVHLRR